MAKAVPRDIFGKAWKFLRKAVATGDEEGELAPAVGDKATVKSTEAPSETDIMKILDKLGGDQPEEFAKIVDKWAERRTKGVGFQTG